MIKETPKTEKKARPKETGSKKIVKTQEVNAPRRRRSGNARPAAGSQRQSRRFTKQNSSVYK